MSEYRVPGIYVEEKTGMPGPSEDVIGSRFRRPSRPLRPKESVEVGVVSTFLSLAVTLLDAVSGEILTDRASDVRISFLDLDVDPTPHRSGYYLFTDLTVEAVTIAVDGGERYRDEERTVAPLSATAVVDVRLFAHGSTFVHGVVRDPGGEPLSGVRLSVSELDGSADSDRNGEFALAFRDVEDSVEDVDGTRLVRVNGSDPTIDVRHDDRTDGSVAVEVEADSVRYYELTYATDGMIEARTPNPD